MQELRKLLKQAVDYQVAGKHESAEVLLRDAIKWIDQNHPTEGEIKARALFVGRIKTFMEHHRYEDALPFLEEIMILCPNNRDGFAEYLKCLWSLGQHKNFWTIYENRRRFFDNLVIYERIFGTANMWDGESSLDGKTILVYGEQGAGDQIQFVRYLPYLKEKYNCRIILNCSQSLEPVFRQLNFVDHLLPKEETFLSYKPLEFDVHYPLMSLPRCLGLWEPVPELFLKAPGKAELFDPGKKKVGFVFTANPRSFGSSWRSIEPQAIRHILHPDVQYYNLHHEQRCEINGVVDLCDSINNFGDLANYVELMDQIITIDSALLHLAGCMGKETLALIPSRADWKWDDEKTTPWYRSVQLAHQKASWNWSRLLHEALNFVKPLSTF